MKRKLINIIVCLNLGLIIIELLQIFTKFDLVVLIFINFFCFMFLFNIIVFLKKKKLKILLYAETNLKFIISNIFINLNLYINVLRNYLKLKFNQQETNLYFYFIILESSD